VTSHRTGNGSATCSDYEANGFRVSIQILPTGPPLLIRGAGWLRSRWFSLRRNVRREPLADLGRQRRSAGEARATQTLAAITQLSMMGSPIEPRKFLASTVSLETTGGRWYLFLVIRFTAGRRTDVPKQGGVRTCRCPGTAGSLGGCAPTSRWQRKSLIDGPEMINQDSSFRMSAKAWRLLFSDRSRRLVGCFAERVSVVIDPCLPRVCV
jgi:hypothetical protein